MTLSAWVIVFVAAINPHPAVSIAPGKYYGTQIECEDARHNILQFFRIDSDLQIPKDSYTLVCLHQHDILP